MEPLPCPKCGAAVQTWTRRETLTVKAALVSVQGNLGEGRLVRRDSTGTYAAKSLCCSACDWSVEAISVGESVARHLALARLDAASKGRK
jgi:hypothetical protein